MNIFFRKSKKFFFDEKAFNPKHTGRAEEGGATGAVAATPGETAAAAAVGVTVGDGTGTTGGGTVARTGGETGRAAPTDEGTEPAALIGGGKETKQVRRLTFLQGDLRN